MECTFYRKEVVMNDTLLIEPMLDDYPANTTPGWTHQNEGHHIVVNSQFGQLEVGMVPGKSWDQWLFHENNGGGSLVVGYHVTPSGVLEVMMLKANRFNLKGTQDDWELPGGFVDDGETKLGTAIRETIEETDQLINPDPVQGRGFVGNRAFFQLNSEDEGTSVFAFELTPEQIEAINKSDKLELMPWSKAVTVSRDALSIAALARLGAQLNIGLLA